MCTSASKPRPHRPLTRPRHRLQGAAPHRARARRGFNLIEIMVVIAIIGLLMTVVGVSVIRYLEQARVDTTLVRLTQVSQGLEAWSLKRAGRYPSTAEGLEAALDWMPDQTLPLDAWERPVRYVHPAELSRASYDLVSLGRDGEPGGDGFDADIVFKPRRD